MYKVVENRLISQMLSHSFMEQTSQSKHNVFKVAEHMVSISLLSRS